ncbi:Fanconi-associated nuclease [Heracleum sosnowskyi]|uniref:Fanconi-associated nuclease n=1 Tax=Heracleum sosnowskyi TaxID=360622 RepID=A0AAD8HEI5_9APIA|nr:Fanconi-associated nuclease [Heracleum sosnowskyi]
MYAVKHIKKKSLTIAENGLLDLWVRAGTRISLQRRVLRLGKPPRRWKTPTFSESVQRKITEVHVQGRPLNCVTGTKSRFYGEDGEQCGVEQVALQYYAGEGGGWQGIHAESGIWLTIFGLLMWDTILCLSMCPMSSATCIRNYSDLPKAARDYVERIEELVGVPVHYIGIGPGRDALIYK